MKKKLLSIALACVLLLGGGAWAEGSEDRLEHFESHGRNAVFYCSGRLVKLRVAPGANRMNGRTVMGEQFKILDHFGEWVHVEITQTLPVNEDARRGMTGWIHVDHIACECDLEKTAFNPIPKSDETRAKRRRASEIPQAGLKPSVSCGCNMRGGVSETARSATMPASWIGR